jgi:hypothetical protein
MLSYNAYERTEITRPDCVFFSMYQHGNQYLMLFRKRICNPNQNVNPSVFNTTYLATYDKNMNLLSEKELLDGNRPTHMSYTTGIEDSRFIDDKSLLCVCCDSNPYWKPEMCHVSFSDKVEKLTPLYIEGMPRQTQKNWLFLKRHSDEEIDLLYWCDPFQVVRANTTTGQCNIIKSYTVDGLALNAHGGSSIFLDPNKVPVEYGNKILVNIRLFEQKPGLSYQTYTHSHWILLDLDYNLVGISDPFKWSDEQYEINTSLCIQDDHLLAPVIFNEGSKYIYKLPLLEVLGSIHPPLFSEALKR